MQGAARSPDWQHMWAPVRRGLQALVAAMVSRAGCVVQGKGCPWPAAVAARIQLCTPHLHACTCRRRRRPSPAAGAGAAGAAAVRCLQAGAASLPPRGRPPAAAGGDEPRALAGDERGGGARCLPGHSWNAGCRALSSPAPLLLLRPLPTCLSNCTTCHRRRWRPSCRASCASAASGRQRPPAWPSCEPSSPPTRPLHPCTWQPRRAAPLGRWWAATAAPPSACRRAAGAAAAAARPAPAPRAARARGLQRAEGAGTRARLPLPRTVCWRPSTLRQLQREGAAPRR